MRCDFLMSISQTESWHTHMLMPTRSTHLKHLEIDFPSQGTWCLVVLYFSGARQSSPGFRWKLQMFFISFQVRSMVLDKKPWNWRTQASPVKNVSEVMWFKSLWDSGNIKKKSSSPGQYLTAHPRRLSLLHFTLLFQFLQQKYKEFLETVSFLTMALTHPSGHVPVAFWTICKSATALCFPSAPSFALALSMQNEASRNCSLAGVFSQGEQETTLTPAQLFPQLSSPAAKLSMCSKVWNFYSQVRQSSLSCKDPNCIRELKMWAQDNKITSANSWMEALVSAVSSGGWPVLHQLRLQG